MQKKLKLFLILLLLGVSIIPWVGVIANSEPPQRGQTISVSFFKADLVAVIQQLAAECGYNVMITPEVKGTVTLQFRQTSFEEILNYIVQANGLTYYREKNNFYIGKIGELPLSKKTTGYFQLRYSEPKPVAEALRKMVSGVEIVVDERTRTVIINGSPEVVGYAGELVKNLDRKLKQVTIEVKVVEVSVSALHQLGIQWKTSNVSNNWGLTASGSEIILDMITNGHSWSAIFKALLDNGNARLVTSPSIATVEGKEASILIGDKIPLLTSKETDEVTKKEKITITYTDVGVNLVFTPWLQTDDEVDIDLKTQVNTLGPIQKIADIDYYTIGQREVKSKIQAKIGETVFLGGLITREERENLRKVPLLGDLPLIRKLFQTNDQSKDERELIITITPRWNQPVKLFSEKDSQ